MIESLLERLMLISNEISQSYNGLISFISITHFYFLLTFYGLTIIGYVFFRLKIKPIIYEKIAISNLLFPFIASFIFLVLPELINYKNPFLSASGFIFLASGARNLSQLIIMQLTFKNLKLTRHIKLFLNFVIVSGTALLLIKSLNLSKTLERLSFLVLKLGIFIIAIQVLLYKEDILSLLPDIDVAFYKKLKLLFRRFYFLFLIFVSLVGGFWITGYEEISISLFWRFLGLTSFITGLSIIHQAIAKAIKQNENLAFLSKEAYLLWLYFEVILSFLIISKLLGVYKLLSSWLNLQLITIGETPLYLSQLIEAILIGTLFYLLALLLRKLIEVKGDVVTDSPELRKIISKASFYTIIFIGLLASLRALGVGPSILAVFAGTLGIGLGLGLQDLARNIVGGILIFMEGHFKLNDIISIEINSSSPITGKITKIDYRCVTLKTFDNTEVIVPSSLLASNMVMNWTKSDPIVRRKITLGVSYNSDPRHVERVIFEEVKKHPDVLPDPEPMVLFREIGENSLIFDIYFWVDQNKANPLKVNSDLNFNIWYRFKEEGIEIPYPQIDIHLK
ncbi:MAG: mechanosensitive ion channel [Synergistetes bacterium]|nr:mechanosensitive ion channel [Synergistota bacterium]MCX8128181.1 mechanosensitive ion channel [Synergistota bacterium]MDW8192557.1 mechanosensitive ion channel [Synergistota bacterium]